ncbi:hypothetical protein ACQPZ2_29755 [Nocardia pseudovaccinii]|uniref:hypothetical protein n=1 Tax=Nocardia pseudovaccinii TaxID=189540 RepID=UPI003D8D9672
MNTDRIKRSHRPEGQRPLVLDDIGSFYMTGDLVEHTAVEMGLSDFGIIEGDRLPVNQLYVQFMVPQHAMNYPVVMVHGLTISGKGYETKPDGRMGWSEYFLRQSFPVYLVDQVSRGRSGFNQAAYNMVRAGLVSPESQPPIIRVGNKFVWVEFRLGPEPGVPFADTQFPIEFIDDFLMQTIPSPYDFLVPNETPRQLGELAAELDGAVLIGHSESAMFPIDAALSNPAGTKGLVVIEAEAADVSAYTDDQIATLASIPILFVFGDHLDTELLIPGSDWRTSFANAQKFIAKVNDAGGNAKMLYPPDLGIYGNSHMIMNDKNSDQIADLIIEWIQKNVGRPSA